MNHEEAKEIASMLKLDSVMSSTRARWIGQQKKIRTHTHTLVAIKTFQIQQFYTNIDYININFETIKYDEQNLFQIISVCVCVYFIPMIVCDEPPIIRVEDNVRPGNILRVPNISQAEQMRCVHCTHVNIILLECHTV